MIRLLTVEIVLWFSVFFQSLDVDKVGAFEKYGGLGIAALAIVANFYLMKMVNDRDKERDKRNAERDSAQTAAMQAISQALVRMETKLDARE